jgi:hypothetical protein
VTPFVTNDLIAPKHFNVIGMIRNKESNMSLVLFHLCHGMSPLKNDYIPDLWRCG